MLFNWTGPVHADAKGSNAHWHAWQPTKIFHRKNWQIMRDSRRVAMAVAVWMVRFHRRNGPCCDEEDEDETGDDDSRLLTGCDRSTRHR